MDGRCAASTFFADGYPLLVTTTAAGTELAERVQSAGGPHVDLLRFRANLVLDGLEAHEEDHLAQLHIRTAGRRGHAAPGQALHALPDSGH
jgi:uncharacterized protein YcbX